MTQEWKDGHLIMDEMQLQEKFTEKLKELLEIAKKKKNVLEYQEITEHFADMELDADKMEKVLEFLEANNIDTLKTNDVDVDDEPDGLTV